MLHTKNKNLYLQQTHILYLERKLRITYIEDHQGHIYTSHENCQI